jgi:DNA polymerase-3 subunit delta'
VPLASIVGHAPLVALLRQAVRRGRVPQSLIFAGPEGVGKHAVAVALAQAVNCPRRQDGDACGVCGTCVRIARGQHADVAFIDRGQDASIKIKQLRDRVIDVVGYRPFEAQRRVFVIDPADEMTIEAQDALLKTLEEPPPSTMIVLVTAYPDTLLPTIQSRCRRLRFGLLAERDVVAVLVDRCGVAPDAARRLAAMSGGQVGRALAEQDGDVDDDRDAALALLAAAGRGPIPLRLKAAAAFAQHAPRRRSRDAIGHRLALLASLVRDVGIVRASSGVALANLDLADTLGSLAPQFDLTRLTAAFDVITRAEHALDRNASPKIVADWVAVSI